LPLQPQEKNATGEFPTTEPNQNDACPPIESSTSLFSSKNKLNTYQVALPWLPAPLSPPPRSQAYANKIPFCFRLQRKKHRQIRWFLNTPKKRTGLLKTLPTADPAPPSSGPKQEKTKKSPPQINQGFCFFGSPNFFFSANCGTF